MRGYLLQGPGRGRGDLWAGPWRERLQLGGASCPGSRWERSRRWAQLNRGGKSRAGKGVGQARTGGELVYLGCPRGGGHWAKLPACVAL